MTPLNPIAAWLFLFLPLLILLYFLRLRRPKKQIASTLLWRRVLNDLRVNTPFQKLRKALLLLLQIAVLCALAAAAIRPLQQLNTSPKESIIVLLDRSASMQTLHERGSRFSEASRHLARLIDELGTRSEMAVISFSNTPVIEQSFTNDRRELASALSRQTCGDGAGTLEKALELAGSLAIARPQTRVVLISDSTPTTTGGELPFELEFIKVGSPKPNIAITGLEARRLPERPERVEVHISLRKYGKAPPALVIVAHDGKRLASQLPNFGDENATSLVIPVTLPNMGILSIQCASDDALAVDNQAWCVVMAPQKFYIRVDNLQQDEAFFRAALQAVPFAEASLDTEDALFHATIRGIDTLPTEPPNEHELLVIQNGTKLVSANDAIDWETSTSLTRHLDFSELRISSRSGVPLSEAYQTLVRANNAPLVSTLRSGDSYRTVLSFSPSQSNWPLQPSFPLFLHNWISHLQRFTHTTHATNSRVGERRRLMATVQASTYLSISGPSDRAKLSAVAGRAVASHLDRVGIYECVVGDAPPVPIAVNLNDADESNTISASSVISTMTPIATIPARTPASKEWTIACLAFALLILSLEWAAYHRILALPSKINQI